MISKSQIKYVQSLHAKKFRVLNNAFIVEGAKSVLELLESNFIIETLFVTADFYKENKKILDKQNPVVEVSITELEQISTFLSNKAALAVVKTKENTELLVDSTALVLVLDNIRDPGNLGTIIRVADWYGIKKIICSEETVEFYNPKVINATMGSFLRVQMYYTNLVSYFSKNKLGYIAGAVMDGANVHQLKLPKAGCLVIGNESNGISDEVMEFLTEKITIAKRGGAESLNAGIATAILLDNFFRNE